MARAAKLRTLGIVLALAPTMAASATLAGCASSTTNSSGAASARDSDELSALLRRRTGAPSGWPSYPGRGFTFKAPPGLVPDGLGMMDPNSPMALGGLKGNVRILWEFGPPGAELRPGPGSERRANIVSASVGDRNVWVEDDSGPSSEVTAYFEPDEAGYALTFVIAAPDMTRDDLLETAAEIIRSIRFR